jgi:hypothetical protein
MLHNTPVYLISGHACIAAEIGDTGTARYGGEEFPFSFTVPRNTFILSFSEPGSATCLNKSAENFIQSQVELIRQLFYLHGPDEFLDHSAESIFSRTMRATGSPGERIRFPNIIYTFEPPHRGWSRAMNDFGVFDISDYKTIKRTSNPDSLIAQFDHDLPADNINKTNWTLDDIIKRVYHVTGTDRGIFLNLGCLTPCRKDSSSIDKAAGLMRYADIMYRSIIPVVGRRNMDRLRAETLMNHTNKPGMILGAISMEEFRHMLESGLYDPAAFEDYMIEFHQSEHNMVREIIKEFVAKAEAKAKAKAEAKAKAKAEAKAEAEAEAKAEAEAEAKAESKS